MEMQNTQPQRCWVCRRELNVGARILIIEDEQIVVEDLKRKLTRMGHQVIGTAAAGDEAVRLAADLQPEVVLTDIRLPGSMDGCEAARLIQEMMSIPIIYLTAYTEVFLIDPKKMQPPGLCVSKPFSFDQLKTTLDVALSVAFPSARRNEKLS
jgi:CheY-like chemotaxis protein